MIYVGIDPDIEKSGQAVKITNHVVEEPFYMLTTETFHDVVKMFFTLPESRKKEFMYLIEAGWLNPKSNYHPKQGARVREKIAKNVGENHAVGKLIAQMCEVYGIPYKLVIPKSRKVDAKEFKQLTGWEGKTNQEMRDAGMLVWREMNEQKILERVKK